MFTRWILGLSVLTLILPLTIAWAAPEESLPEIALVDPPLTLRDEDGKPEANLMDPFAAHTGSESSNGTMQRTSLGDLSSEFQILSIVVPTDPSRPPLALIRLHSQEEPTLVHPGDLIRIEQSPNATTKRTARLSKRQRVPGAESAATSDAVQTMLDRFTFYLYVKDIKPTYLEVYRNKKQPDETIILSW